MKSIINNSYPNVETCCELTTRSQFNNQPEAINSVWWDDGEFYEIQHQVLF